MIGEAWGVSLGTIMGEMLSSEAGGLFERLNTGVFIDLSGVSNLMLLELIAVPSTSSRLSLDSDISGLPNMPP